MTYKIPGDGVQPLLSGQQVDLLGKFPLQFLLLVHVQVGPLDGVQNPIGNLWVVEVSNFVPSVFVVQRHSGPILHGTLEVIHGYVAAKGALRDVVVGQEGGPGKTDTGGGG